MWFPWQTLQNNIHHKTTCTAIQGTSVSFFNTTSREISNSRYLIFTNRCEISVASLVLFGQAIWRPVLEVINWSSIILSPVCISFKIWWRSKLPGDHLSIKMSSYQYRDHHVKDKTVSRPSYLWHGNPHTRKTVFILRQALVAFDIQMSSSDFNNLSMIGYRLSTSNNGRQGNRLFWPWRHRAARLRDSTRTDEQGTL